VQKSSTIDRLDLDVGVVPRILRLRSAPKPPMIETTRQSASELNDTPTTESRLMIVKNPLFDERTWRAATKATKLAALERDRGRADSASAMPAEHEADPRRGRRRRDRPGARRRSTIARPSGS
jgi:hypothetical protein